MIITFNALQHLHYLEIGKHLGRIPKIKSFIDKYNWEGILYPSGKITGKNCEK